jgi:hypothetical protein
MDTLVSSWILCANFMVPLLKRFSWSIIFLVCFFGGEESRAKLNTKNRETGKEHGREWREKEEKI